MSSRSTPDNSCHLIIKKSGRFASNSKLEAFARLEASRKAATEAIDYDVDREEAMNEKYAKFSLSQLRHRQRSLMQLKKIPSRLLRIVCRINVQRMSELITLSPAM